jgi:NAD(P)-dependent dehydrogenase (short-subunit alcohol dehydrogenase family)
MRRLTESRLSDLRAPRRVNAVSPGVIETGWWDEVPEAERRATFAAFAERVPVGRNGTAEDVAQAILALIENSFLTGIVLPCDGGLRLTYASTTASAPNRCSSARL